MGKFTSKYKQRNRSTQSLMSQIEKDTSKSLGDDRYWKLETDKSDNGQAIIRFLPAVKDEDSLDREVSYVQTFDHSFKGPGGWYIERSRVSIEGDYDDDPVSVLNAKLWNTGKESLKNQVRNQRRNKNYHANIYVVKDPQNPDNEGKVFLFRFGAEILEKIKEALSPEFEDDGDGFNPFDLMEGADFKIRARKGSNGMRTYDKSSFGSQQPIADPDGNELDDDALEAVLESTHSVMELIDPDSKYIKSYEELEARLNRVLQLGGAGVHAPDTDSDDIFGEDEDEEEDYIPDFGSSEADDHPSSSSQDDDDDEDDDEDLEEFFANMAKDK
jgi:hypothetical protein